jgi:putative transposase
MSRKPRLHVEGGFYHVILRGNGGEKIFFAQRDRDRFFLLLQEGIERFKYRLHAYCLMTNHVHLVIQVGALPLSKIIQNLSFRYTKYINKKKNRVGHLFQGRYTALLIDADSYMLELVRYIHNNPVRAGMVQRAADYKWSSHQVYLGLQELPFLTRELVLGQFSKTENRARKRFAEFVDKGCDEGHRGDLYKGELDSRVLGDERFAEQVLSRKAVRKKPRLDRIVKYVCGQTGVTERELSSVSRQRRLSEIRGMIGWLATRLETSSLTDVSNRFNRDLATMSRAVRSIDERRERSEELKSQLTSSRKALTK